MCEFLRNLVSVVSLPQRLVLGIPRILGASLQDFMAQESARKMTAVFSFPGAVDLDDE